MMFDQYKDKITKETLEHYPNEAVWIIDNDGCHNVENISPTPTQDFLVDKDVMLHHTINGIQAVIHSHPHYHCCPSESDMIGQINTGVPWGIISTDGSGTTDILWWKDGESYIPLYDRTFIHGVTDCYSFVKDFYKEEYGIHLPEFPRSWDWWHKGKDLYTDGFSKAGFYRIDPKDVKEGDMWVSQIRSNVPNHAGVILKNSLIAHHPSSNKPVDPTRRVKVETLERLSPYITGWYRQKERDDNE